MKIIWIDDDIDIIEPVTRLLIENGHKIEPIHTVQDALEASDDLKTCDLILLDMILPPGNSDQDFGYYSGIALLRRLREEGVVTPVIVFSVVRLSKIQEQLDELNVAGYVLKPALPSELKDAVDAVLEAEHKPGAG